MPVPLTLVLENLAGTRLSVHEGIRAVRSTQEAVYQESFAHCLEDGNKTPSERAGACNRCGNDGFKDYWSSVKNIAERCLENAAGDVLAEAEDVIVRVLEHEVAFWEMSHNMLYIRLE